MTADSMHAHWASDCPGMLASNATSSSGHRMRATVLREIRDNEETKEIEGNVPIDRHITDTEERLLYELLTDIDLASHGGFWFGNHPNADRK